MVFLHQPISTRCSQTTCFRTALPGNSALPYAESSCAAISVVSTKMETHALQALLQRGTPNVSEQAIQILILGIGLLAAVLLNVRT
jgi:hypothetical protein